MPTKVVLFYNQGNRGWSETWYTQDNSLPTDLTVGIKKILKYAIAFRAAGTVLYAVKFSDEVVTRRSILFLTGEEFQIQSPPSGTDLPDVATTDGAWRIQSASGHSRQIALRGLRDQDVQRTSNGVDVPSPGLLTGVKNYLTAAYNRSWCLRVQKNQIDDALPVYIVKNLSIAFEGGDATKFELLGDPVPPYAVGTKIRFLGIPENELIGFPRLSQVIRIDTGPPNTTFFRYRLRGFNSFVPNNLRVTALQYNYEFIADWSFIRFSERKTGRPFGSLRGARRPLARAV